ncbi:MAG: OB-fold domain-containing protein [Actinomycetota bacterium]
MTTRPAPIPDELSAPYWAAAANGSAVLPRCGSCGQFDLPPEPVCRRCGSVEPDWRYETVSGRGSIISWTIVRKSFVPGFDVPFVLVDVAVDEQPDLRLIGRLVDGADVALELGDQVETVHEPIDDDRAVPAYRLVGRG